MCRRLPKGIERWALRRLVVREARSSLAPWDASRVRCAEGGALGAGRPFCTDQRCFEKGGLVPSTLAAARAAKAVASALCRQWPSVVGIGITRLGGGYGLKINLRTPSPHPFPPEVQGVPVVVEVTGQPSAV
jgi:hypothetical protein